MFFLAKCSRVSRRLKMQRFGTPHADGHEQYTYIGCVHCHNVHYIIYRLHFSGSGLSLFYIIYASSCQWLVIFDCKFTLYIISFRRAEAPTLPFYYFEASSRKQGPFYFRKTIILIFATTKLNYLLTFLGLWTSNVAQKKSFSCRPQRKSHSSPF